MRAKGVGLGALVLGFFIVALSIPRIGAAFTSLSAPIAMFDLEQGRTLTAEQLVQIETDIDRALEYDVETASLYGERSYFSLRRVLEDDNNSLSRSDLTQALADIEAALKRRPLDAYLWTRYTHVSYLLDGLSPYTLSALDRSFRYGSKERQLFQFRMTLCMREWDRLPIALQQTVREQITFGASHPSIWGHILADLPDAAGERLLGFLASTSADTAKAQRIANALRIRRGADQ